MRISKRQWLLILAVNALIICRWGYEFGRNDQMQILGYAHFLAEPDLYPSDHFIQTMHEKVPNERFMVSWLLSWTDSIQEWFCLIAFLVTNIAIVAMLFRIMSRFFQRDLFFFAGAIFLFIPLYHINLGSNELTYNSFFVSQLVNLILLYALDRFIDKQFTLSFLIIGLSGILQPVLAVHFAVALGALLLWWKIRDLEGVQWSDLLRSYAAYAFTGGFWILFLKFFFDEQSDWTDAAFFQVLFEFRAPHHYLPSGFNLKHALVLLPLFLFGWGYFSIESKALQGYFTFTFVGLLTYIFLVEGFHLVDIAALQWFKSSIFIEAFSVLALFALLDQMLPFRGESDSRKRVDIRNVLSKGLILGSFACLGISLFAPKLLPWTVRYDFPWVQDRGLEVELAEYVKVNTPNDALFLHPILFTELKVYGERSSVIEYKIMVHRKNAMKTWFGRLTDLYQITGKENGFEVITLADQQYRNIDINQLRKWKEAYGIDHFITFKDHSIEAELIFENDAYRLYQIP